MKKNLIIGILFFVSILTSVFAYYQQTVARHYETIAIESVKKAEEMNRVALEAKSEAERQKIIAHVNAMEANRQRAIAIEQSQLR